MKTGLVITTYNRPEDLKRTLDSLADSIFPPEFEVYIVDDCSDIMETWNLVQSFNIPNVKITKTRNVKRYSMFHGLKIGFEYFYNNGFEVLLNLDSDTLVKRHWLMVLLKLHKLFSDHIISGFNTLNHPIMESFPAYHTKKDIGGINMLFGRNLFSLISPCLMSDYWDWKIVEAYIGGSHKTSRQISKPFIVTRPSVIQHIATSSVAGHYPTHPDRAEDWI